MFRFTNQLRLVLHGQQQMKCSQIILLLNWMAVNHLKIIGGNHDGYELMDKTILSITQSELQE